MPIFTIRAVMTQTLIDSHDYKIEADTPEAAATRLWRLLRKAGCGGGWHDTRTFDATDAQSISSADQPYIVRPLDPSEVDSTEEFFYEIDPDTSEEGNELTTLDDSDPTGQLPAPEPEQAAPQPKAPPLVIEDTSDRATIRAALRFYQQAGMGEPDNRSSEIHDIATDGGSAISLDEDGIDALCERINLGSAG